MEYYDVLPHIMKLYIFYSHDDIVMKGADKI